MINRKHITIIVVSVLMIVASVIYSTSAMTIDVEKMECLTASSLVCGLCGRVVNCATCIMIFGRDTYSQCTFVEEHVACSDKGALSYDQCACAGWSTDCGSWVECYDDRDCLDCDEPVHGCYGCTSFVEGTTVCP